MFTCKGRLISRNNSFISFHLKVHSSLIFVDDDEVTPEELQVFWEAGLYGSSETATELFTRLDLDSDNILTRSNWTDLFHALDCSE